MPGILEDEIYDRRHIHPDLDCDPGMDQPLKPKKPSRPDLRSCLECTKIEQIGAPPLSSTTVTQFDHNGSFYDVDDCSTKSSRSESVSASTDCDDEASSALVSESGGGGGSDDAKSPQSTARGEIVPFLDGSGDKENNRRNMPATKPSHVMKPNCAQARVGNCETFPTGDEEEEEEEEEDIDVAISAMEENKEIFYERRI